MSLREQPHYEIHSTELASWLESQGVDRWWTVDGDPRLMGIVSFPCPADELAEALRRIDEPFLIQASTDDDTAQGQTVDRTALDQLAVQMTRFGDVVPGKTPDILTDRVFNCCWKSRPVEWLLFEDSLTTKHVREEMGAVAPR